MGLIDRLRVKGARMPMLQAATALEQAKTLILSAQLHMRACPQDWTVDSWMKDAEKFIGEQLEK